jgi:thiamine biosynthesis lipoprotein
VTARLLTATARLITAGRLVTFASRAMASPLRMSVASMRGPQDVRRASAAWDAAREEFEASEQAMSRFRDRSEITLLNRRSATDPPTRVSRRLSVALAACDRAHRITGGRFDPRVLWDLERLGDRGAAIGVRDDLDMSHRPPPGRIVESTPDGRVSLPEPVDLGGIGKGLALRWASSSIERHGVASFLLEAGGDLIARGESPDGGPWLVGIEDPRAVARPLAVLAVNDGAVATSSVRRRRWRSGDRTVHHLIDPRTGEPGGPGLVSVTVAGVDPAWSEIWSKALFLEGIAGIAALARQRGLAAWWVGEDGGLELTAAARARTIWAASDDRPGGMTFT